MEDLIIEFEDDIIRRERDRKKKEYRRKYSYEYRIKNKEKIKKYHIENYIKNKEKINARKDKYVIKNKERIKKYQNEHYIKNKEKIKEYRKSRRDFTRCRRYGLHGEWYKEKLIEQNGKCAICGTDKPGGSSKKLHIDHCHKTKKVRGLLCTRCNLAIGYFLEDINVIETAKQYLIKHQ